MCSVNLRRRGRMMGRWVGRVLYTHRQRGVMSLRKREVGGEEMTT